MIFMGYFIHATNQEEIEEADRRHGEFNLIVEAERADRALELFRQRVIEYRENSTFFEGECSIYLVQLFEFDRFPNQSAMMINYKSIAGDPVMPFIGCSVPSGTTLIFKRVTQISRTAGCEDRKYTKFTKKNTINGYSYPRVLRDLRGYKPSGNVSRGVFINCSA